jgi:hypothetical protein
MLNPPFSVELTKQGMWTSVENPSVAVAVEFENQQQTLTAMTQDRTEATTAFLEKRPPSTSDSARPPLGTAAPDHRDRRPRRPLDTVRGLLDRRQ